MANTPQNPNVRRQRRTQHKPLTLFVLGTAALWLLLALLGTQTFSYRQDFWYSMVNDPGEAMRVLALMIPGALAAFLMWVGWVAGRRW